jgi:DNA-binding PadR family transcriptional regulator
MLDPPSNAELTVMVVLLKRPKGIYARQLLELSDGAIRNKSEHKLLSRLKDKGYVAATEEAQPIYTLTEAGRIIARAFVRASK